MHARTIVLRDRLGHEGRGLAVTVRDVLDDVFHRQQVIGFLGQGVEARADFALAGRLGYNSIEHLVLAVYCQILILAAIILGLLPTLIWNDPEFIRTYKSFSGYLLYGVKLVIVAVAFRQFFLVDLPREWPRLAASLVIYLAASWVLLRLYAYMVLMLVRMQLD